MYGVIVTYAGLLLHQTTILSRKLEPTQLLGIRTIVLVWHLLIYVGQSKSSRNSSDWKSATTDSIWSWSWKKTLASLTDPFMRFCPTIAKFVPCGFSITMTRRATHRLLCSNSSLRKAFLSSPNHRTLWISLRVTFGCSLFWKCSRGRVSHHGGHRIECDGWTPEYSKRNLPPVHPTMAGSMEQCVCVCAQGSDFEGD